MGRDVLKEAKGSAESDWDMSETTTRALGLGLGLAVAYVAFIAWLYARQP